MDDDTAPSLEPEFLRDPPVTGDKKFELTWKEWSDWRRQNRTYIKALEKRLNDIATAYEGALDALRTAGEDKGDFPTRLAALEGRLLLIESEKALSRIPEAKRSLARRLLVTERPADVDAWVTTILKDI